LTANSEDFLTVVCVTLIRSQSVTDTGQTDRRTPLR